MFLDFRHHARAISRIQFSSSTLLSISDSTKLYRSTIPFNLGHSAPVACTFILKASHSVTDSSLINSPLLSVKNLSTVLLTITQHLARLE